jgi:hypothetical protein
MIDFLIIVNDPKVAQHACAVAGVSAFVDLERLGKAERQGHLDSWKSSHGPGDVTRMREAVPVPEASARDGDPRRHGEISLISPAQRDVCQVRLPPDR